MHPPCTTDEAEVAQTPAFDVSERQIALAYYGIAEFSSVIDHLEAMRRAGLYVHARHTDLLYRDRRILVHHLNIINDQPLVTSAADEEAMVSEARTFLAQHQHYLDEFEALAKKGGDTHE